MSHRILFALICALPFAGCGAYAQDTDVLNPVEDSVLSVPTDNVTQSPADTSLIAWTANLRVTKTAVSPGGGGHDVTLSWNAVPSASMPSLAYYRIAYVCGSISTCPPLNSPYYDADRTQTSKVMSRITCANGAKFGIYAVDMSGSPGPCSGAAISTW
jgi:hypothetical protein